MLAKSTISFFKLYLPFNSSLFRYFSRRICLTRKLALSSEVYLFLSDDYMIFFLKLS